MNDQTPIDVVYVSINKRGVIAPDVAVHSFDCYQTF